VKSVLELKPCLVTPAANAGDPGHGAATAANDGRREAREGMLKANTFQQGFEFAGAA
jgi:hypothetical protein